MSFFRPKSNEELESETKRMEFEKENLRIQREREEKYSSAKKELNREKYAGVHNFVTGAKEKLSSMKKANEERNRSSTPARTSGKKASRSKGFSRGFNNQPGPGINYGGNGIDHSVRGIDHSMPGLFNKEEPKKKGKINERRGFPFD